MAGLRIDERLDKLLLALDKLKESQEKTDAQIVELKKSQEKTDIQLAKTDAQLAKTDAQLAKTDIQLSKTDAQLAKTDRKLDKLAKMYGGVANNQGDVAEGFYYNSLKDDLTIGGVQYDIIVKNVTKKYKNVEDEFDIVLINGKEVYIIEVKYKVHPIDIDRIINKKHPNFKKLYPEYKNYQHHLGIATFYISDELKEKALSLGINVLKRKGKVIEEIAA